MEPIIDRIFEGEIGGAMEFSPSSFVFVFLGKIQ